MKKLLIVVAVLVLAASFCYAQDTAASKEAEPKATEPVGAVVETTGVFVGNITSVVEESAGANKGSLILADESGKTKIFPVDPTVKILDNTFNALTFNQLKKGEKVSVEYTKGATEKTKSVTVQ